VPVGPGLHVCARAVPPGCPAKLKSANLGGLERLQSVGVGFMVRCESLESIDTTGMTALLTVADDFLSWCSKLKSANIRRLVKSGEDSMKTDEDSMMNGGHLSLFSRSQGMADIARPM
jgi:hypothetical protein